MNTVAGHFNDIRDEFAILDPNGDGRVASSDSLSDGTNVYIPTDIKAIETTIDKQPSIEFSEESHSQTDDTVQETTTTAPNLIAPSD